ncbi:hypothetical protein ACP70R_032451 [Stipagrostis hirtigluma subsp. patula]
MNHYQDDLADGDVPWWQPDAGGEDTSAGAGDNSSAGMLDGYYTDDLFELMWQGGGESRVEHKPALSRLCLSPTIRPPEPAHAPDMRSDPAPSEDEMAAWLGAIVKGEEQTSGGGRQQTTGVRYFPAKGLGDMAAAMRVTSTDKTDELPTTEGIMLTKDTGSDSRERRKTTGREIRRSHHGETHNLTEKRRRHKINEKLKTLQELVPGCDKQSNHASTLDQTIQYMKALQKQVRAMSVNPAGPATAAAAVYPVVQPQYVPPGTPVAVAPMVLGPTPAMVRFGPMLPLPHYPAMMMPAAAAPCFASPAGHPRHGPSNSSSRGKGSSSILRQRE